MATESLIDCIVFALNRESGPFLKAFPGRKRLTPAPCPVWEAKPSLLVVVAGVGSSRWKKALQWLRSQGFPLRSLLSAGFAGGLSPDLGPGDVVQANQILSGSEQWQAAECHLSGARTGAMLTTSHLVATVEEKKELREQSGAMAVDMESATAARFCADEGVPFHCLRAISDDAGTAVSPKLLPVLSGESISLWQCIRTIVPRPGLWPEVWRMAKSSGLAAKKLSVSLQEWLLNNAQLVRSESL